MFVRLRKPYDQSLVVDMTIGSTSTILFTFHPKDNKSHPLVTPPVQTWGNYNEFAQMSLPTLGQRELFTSLLDVFHFLQRDSKLLLSENWDDVFECSVTLTPFYTTGSFLECLRLYNYRITEEPPFVARMCLMQSATTPMPIINTFQKRIQFSSFCRTIFNEIQNMDPEQQKRNKYDPKALLEFIQRRRLLTLLQSHPKRKSKKRSAGNRHS